jgi:acetolactate synthase-1/2/3 large subunit
MGEPMPAREMTGGMAIVEALLANGVDTIFGLPGAQMYPLFDALAQRRDRVRTFGARHEQTCGYMAFGYARATGRPGVFAVVPGPGVLNATAALCTALGCCAPVLCITGQVPSAFIGKGRGHLQELPDQLATLRSLTKWSARIERVEDAPALVNEAFERMLGGRPGPVALEMAWDIMAASAMLAPPAAAVIPPLGAADPANVLEAARRLIAARRPMIMTGSGAQHASESVRALAEELDAPVAAFRGGRGVVSEDHPLGISSYAARLLWPQTDLVLGIGTRLELPFMRWTGMMKLVDRPSSPTVIRLDIDSAEMGRLVPHVGIVADADIGTRALLDEVRALKREAGDTARDGRDIAAAIASKKAQARNEIEAVQPQMAYLDVIRATLPRDGIFVTELSQTGFASYFGYPVYEPRSYISEGYQGTRGFGFPTALGVKVAHPDRVVVSVTGDGGFMFAVQELSTAAQEGIGLIVLLFNNDSYGNVLRDQRVGFGNRIIGATLKNPDFMQLARAFDIESHRVDHPEALRAILSKVIRTATPVLIEIKVPQGSEMSPWPFIHA